MLSDTQKSLLNDEFFKKESSTLTAMMLDQKMDINDVTAIVKEYTVKYACIKENDLVLASKYTAEMWWKTRDNTRQADHRFVSSKRSDD